MKKNLAGNSFELIRVVLSDYKQKGDVESHPHILNWLSHLLLDLTKLFIFLLHLQQSSQLSQMIAKYSSTTRPLKRESENIPIWRHVIFPYTMYRADRGTQKAVPWRDKHGTAAIVRVMECTVCTSIVHFYRRLSWLTRVTLELIGMGIATCLRCGFGVYYGLTRQGTFSRGSFMPG